MVKPVVSRKPLPPLWRDIVKFIAILAFLFLLLLLGLVIADLFNLIPDDPR